MGNIGGRQRPLRNVVLAHEYDALLLLCIPNEFLEKLERAGVREMRSCVLIDIIRRRVAASA